MSQNLSVLKKIGFGSANLGTEIFLMTVGMMLPIYLTDTLGLTTALLAAILITGKTWDAVTDPVIGYISDRTIHKLGRRKIYIIIGLVPFSVSYFLLFVNPGLNSLLAKFIWTFSTYILLNTAFTLVFVPYSSLVPELTADFHERTSLNGFRQFFSLIGCFIVGGMGGPITHAYSDNTSGFFYMGLIFSLLIFISILITILSVKEKSPVQTQPPTPTNIIKNNLEALKNIPFRIIVVVFAINITAISVFTGAIKYYFKYVLLAEKSDTAGIIVFMSVSFVAIPLWVLISKKIGKKATLTSGLVIMVTGLLSLFILGQNTGLNGNLALFGLIGIGFAAQTVMPHAIVPDTIEYDYLHSGLRREGLYYGQFTFFAKVGAGIGGALIGIILNISGYVAMVSQSAKAVSGICVMQFLIPAVLLTVSIFVLQLYPINKKEYHKIMSKIADKYKSQEGE